VILLSHDHFDHLCKPTMIQLARSGVPVVTALGVGAHLERYGFATDRITELDWHESIELAGGPAHRHAGAALLRSPARRAQHHAVGVVGDPVRTPQGVLLRRYRPDARIRGDR
jgi:L-ascorbate metabolism protein UlaG (beta-lactamase superfamily)